MRLTSPTLTAAFSLLALSGCPDTDTPADPDGSTGSAGSEGTTTMEQDGTTTSTTAVDSTGEEMCVPDPENAQALPAPNDWPEVMGSAERLREYVQAEDPAYTYSLHSEQGGVGYTTYFLQMDSLEWRTEEEISPSLWSHWLTIVVPDMLTTTKAHLVINGGSSSEDLPSMAELPIFIQVAMATGSPVAILGQIPVQPCVAPDRPEEMREDDLVAYSWRKAMETQDPTWAAYFPMTKASVRALDTTQDFLDGMFGQSPDGFIVTGFSKRGATAWLTAAADDRVEAVVPGVFNALELATLAERQFQSYDQYADAAEDYVDERILQEIRSPEGYFLRSVVDPVNYLDALTMPHYVLQASGDEFFLADGARFFLDQIQGEATQRIIPNESHSLEQNLEGNLSALVAWYQAILAEEPRPTITEEVAGGVVTIQTDQEPSSVTLWVASTEEIPDFRYTSIADAWEGTPLDPSGPMTYEVTLSTPDQGYDAHLVEFRYPGVGGLPDEQVYSSHVYITPETRPFELDTPLGSPTSLPEWRCELGSGVGMMDPLYATLADALPIVVRGELISDVETLVAVLLADGSEEEQATAQCAAARVNLEVGEMDWYTPATEDTYVWEHITSAEFEDAERALLRCQALNHL